MFWNFAGSTLAKLLTFVAGIVCARLLQQEEYGQFCMIRSTINTFIILGIGGLGVTITKYVSEYRRDDKEHIPSLYLMGNTVVLATGTLCTLFLLFGSSYIAQTILHDATLVFALQLGSILLFFSIINGVQNGVLAGFEDFKSLARNLLLGSVCEALCMLVGAYYYGVNGAILGFGIGFIVIYIANCFTTSKWFAKENLSFLSFKALRIDKLKLLFNYNIPVTFSALLITPVFFIVRSMLVSKCNYSELAIFEAADQCKVIILFIPTAISQIVLPILSSVYKERKTFITTLILNILIISIVSITISLLVYFFSNEIMHLYGNGFVKPLPLRVLAISTIFSAIANVIEMSMYSLGRVWNCFFINIVWAVIVLGTSYYLLSQGFGAEAVSWAILIAYAVSCIVFAINIYYLIRKL